MKRESVTVEKFYGDQAKSLELNLIAGAKGLKRVIREPTINRPGLALAGFTRFFAYKRIQSIGAAEAVFLKSLPEDEREKRYSQLLSFKMPGVVFSRNLKPDRLFLQKAEEADLPVFSTRMITMKFINQATLALEMLFAPHGTEIGSMVDILGVGVIIRGESGIGKSESVLALIERGYSLVSDDITYVTLIDGRDVIGTSSELTRNHMEVRGIGIINVAAMFGIRSIRKEKRVDLVVTLKGWNEVEDVERIGMEQEYVNILGIPTPHVVLPVRPGRDLARLIEVAAFQSKLKSTGHNAAKELNDRLVAQMTHQHNP
jgi:HPr kinase/phosphorylase